MNTLHEYFRFDDGYDTLLLAKGSVAAEGMRIHTDAGSTRQFVADPNDSAPFGELCAKSMVILQPFPQAIETLCYCLVWAGREWFRASIHFNARDDPFIDHLLHQTMAVRRLLTDCLVIHDHAADEGGRTWSCE